MIKGSFLDNQMVGADDLNRLVNLFVGGGVADCFSEGVPYNVSKLNEVYYANLSDGVVPSTDMSLWVSKSNGRAWVAPGTAIFPDGTFAVVTNISENVWESVEYTEGIDQYIYLKSDRVNNCITLCVAESEPMESDNAVVLALFSADGTVTDLRKYAKGKVPSSYSADTGLAGRRIFTITNDTQELKFESNGIAYNYMLIKGNQEVDKDYWRTLSFVDLKTMSSISATQDSNGRGTFEIFSGKFKLAQVNGYGGFYLNITGELTVSGNSYIIALSRNTESTDGWDSYIYPAEITIFLF